MFKGFVLGFAVGGCRLVAGLWPIAVVAGFDDVAAVGDAIEQRRGHLGVAKHLDPLRERQVGGDDQVRLFVEFRDQVEEQRAAVGADEQIAELVQTMASMCTRRWARRSCLPVAFSCSSRLTASSAPPAAASSLLQPSNVKSLKRHQLRVLLSSRKAILSKCVDLENELRGLLNIFGMRLASKVGHGAYDSTVRPLVEADPLLARGLLPLLEARLVLYKTYLKLDNEVQAVTRTDPICKRLMTVRGVGCYRRSRSRRRWMTQLGSRPRGRWPPTLVRPDAINQGRSAIRVASPRRVIPTFDVRSTWPRMR